MSINILPDSVKNTAISGDGRAASRPLTAADRLPTVLLPPGPRPPDPIPNPKRHRMEHRRMTRVQADTVLTGGKVFLGPGLGFAEAVATFGGRVLATGSTAEIAGLAGPGTTRIDLAGQIGSAHV